MDNKKSENDLRSMFIPVEELGANPSDFVVDADYWFDETYKLYRNSCHSMNPLDERQSSEHYIAADKINQHLFSAIGRVGFFRWYALTLFYDESIHKMDEIKTKHNRNHRSTVCATMFSDPGENISNAINNNDDLVNLLQRNPLVANTEVCVENWDSAFKTSDMAVRLNVFLGQGPICDKLFKKEGDQLVIDASLIKGKDVVLPFIWANKKNLKLFGELSKKCVDNGANTVVGIFASRQVPTLDGRESANIPKEYEPASFGPRISFRF